MRRSKINYYLDIAETVLQRGTCTRRNYGAIIVKNDEIISTGYVGAPRGRKNCCDLGYCVREKLNIPRGERVFMVHGNWHSMHLEKNDRIEEGQYEIGNRMAENACPENI